MSTIKQPLDMLGQPLTKYDRVLYMNSTGRTQFRLGLYMGETEHTIKIASIGIIDRNKLKNGGNAQLSHLKYRKIIKLCHENMTALADLPITFEGKTYGFGRSNP